jgi:hypothetical protein
MENSLVEIGMKVIPHSKSYAQDLHNSQHFKMAKEKGRNYLYVNFIHPSKTHKRVFVLSFEPTSPPSPSVGDFFLSSDFEPYFEQ